MRGFRRVAGVAALQFMVASAAWSGPIGPCLVCSNDLLCELTPGGGALFCLGNGSACTMALPCASRPGGRQYDGLGASPASGTGESWAIAITVLDADEDALKAAARRVPLAGTALAPEAVERSAQSVTRGVSGVLDAGILFGSGARAATLRAGGFAGLTLRHVRDGGATRLVVRELRHGRPGAMLASEALADDDLLLVPIRLAGRPRILALQPLVLGDDPAGRARELQERLRVAMHGKPGRELDLAESVD